jgi:hypothetical protein
MVAAALLVPLSLGAIALTPASPLPCAAARAAVYQRCAPVCAQEGAAENEEEEAYLDDLEQALKPAEVPRQGLRIQRALGNGSGRATQRPRRRVLRDGPTRFTRESTQLSRLPSTLRDAYDDFLEMPGQPLLLGSLSLLFGFYLAGALSTVFGAAGFWEPTIALGPLFVGEAITRRYYSLPMNERSPTLRLLNAVKVGFYFGVMLEALKLAG